MKEKQDIYISTIIATLQKLVVLRFACQLGSCTSELGRQEVNYHQVSGHLCAYLIPTNLEPPFPFNTIILGHHLGAFSSESSVVFETLLSTRPLVLSRDVDMRSASSLFHPSIACRRVQGDCFYTEKEICKTELESEAIIDGILAKDPICQHS